MVDTDFWGPPISVYTRADAIADGLFAEVPADIAREHGYLVPVAISAAVHGILAKRGDEYTVWLRDVLNMARIYSRSKRERGDASDTLFPVFVGRKTHVLRLTFTGWDGFTIWTRDEDRS